MTGPGKSRRGFASMDRERQKEIASKVSRYRELIQKTRESFEDAQTGYVGAVVRVEYGRLELEDRNGRRKPFPIGPG